MNLHCISHHSSDTHLRNCAPKCEACILSTDKFGVHVDAGSLCNNFKTPGLGTSAGNHILVGEETQNVC